MLFKFIESKGGENMSEIKIDIKSYTIGLPEIKIYKITLKSKIGVRDETFGSRELAQVFLKGVQAACGLTIGHITIPEVPI